MSQPATMPRFPTVLWRLYWILTALWVTGWIVFFVIETYARDGLRPSVESLGILASIVLLPAIGAYISVLLIVFLVKSDLLLPLMGAAGIGIVAYAILSSFRYEYVKVDSGRSFVQIDNWFGGERACHVYGSRVGCSRWK